MAECTLRLRPVDASVVLCLARPDAVAGLDVPGAFVGTIAPGEALLIAGPGEATAIAARARAQLHASDPLALVEPMTDAWALWSLGAVGAEEAFSRLSAIPLPGARPGFVQGAVCGVGAKVLVLPDRLCVMVSSLVGHEVQRRVEQMCADMAPSIGMTWRFGGVASERET